MNEFTFLTDPDFKELRYYIGASDVPTLALLNTKYGQTPLTLWQEKTGRKEGWKGNERAGKGKELESIVLKWGLEKLKNDYNPLMYDENFSNRFMLSRLNNETRFMGHFSLTECACPDFKFIKSHADLIYDGAEDFIMEAKSAGFFGGKRDEDINKGYDQEDLSANGIPATTFLQVQTQMLCYGISTCYVSVMIDTGLHRLYGPIKAHKKTQEKILAICERFWWNVTNDKPPKPETWKDIIYLNPNFDKDSKIVIGGEKEDKAIEMKKRAEKLKVRRKKDKEELDDIKNALGLMIGENRFLENSEGYTLASVSLIEKFSLKNYKKMKKRRFNQLVKDGFISPIKFRKMNF